MRSPSFISFVSQALAVKSDLSRPGRFEKISTPSVSHCQAVSFAEGKDVARQLQLPELSSFSSSSQVVPDNCDAGSDINRLVDVSGGGKSHLF